MFRSAHTIKGNSSMLGITLLRISADKLETALVKTRGLKLLDNALVKDIQKMALDLSNTFKKHIEESSELFSENFDPHVITQRTMILSEQEYLQIVKTFASLPQKGSFIELEQLLYNISLVPIHNYLSGFAPLVKKTAIKLNKNVSPLQIIGGDIKVNPEKISKLMSVFVHLLRNSIDHGIETPEDREEAGKAVNATIILSAEKMDNGLVIILSDDGKGVNPELVSQKAFAAGLKSEAELKQMSENEIQNLIFLPGFSTKDTVSEISGRGVGLDAVAKEVSEIGGRIVLESKVGVGTKFKIELPNVCLPSKT